MVSNLAWEADVELQYTKISNWKSNISGFILYRFGGVNLRKAERFANVDNYALPGHRFQAQRLMSPPAPPAFAFKWCPSCVASGPSAAS